MKIHKKLFYTGTVILNCLLTACQETPKEDIVKNKAESNLEDEVHAGGYRRRQQYKNFRTIPGAVDRELGSWEYGC